MSRYRKRERPSKSCWSCFNRHLGRARSICIPPLKGPQGVSSNARNSWQIRQANRAVRHRELSDRRELGLQGRISPIGGTSATRGLKDWGDGSASTERLACLKKKKSRRLSTSSGFLVFGLLFYRRQKRSAPRAIPSMVKVDPASGT